MRTGRRPAVIYLNEVSEVTVHTILRPYRIQLDMADVDGLSAVQGRSATVSLTPAELAGILSAIPVTMYDADDHEAIMRVIKMLQRHGEQQ
jgi:hypothetical protein